MFSKLKTQPDEVFNMLKHTETFMGKRLILVNLLNPEVFMGCHNRNIFSAPSPH